jgi:protein TonB
MKQRICLTALLTIVLGGVWLSAAPQAKGAPRLNIYFTKGFNDAAWQKAAFEKVAKAWILATPPALGKKAVVIAIVAREGKLTESKINWESGSADWDKAALETVKKAAPFPALPKSWSSSTLQVDFHFEFSATP